MVSNPSPSSLYDGGPHAVLIASGEKFTIGDGLKPKCTQYSSEVLVVEDGQLDEDTLCYPPTLRVVQEGGYHTTLTQSKFDLGACIGMTFRHCSAFRKHF